MSHVKDNILLFFVSLRTNYVLMSRKKWLFSLILILLAAPVAQAQKSGRDYEGPGNFFIGFDLGSSFSIAENVNSEGLYKTVVPTVSGTLGYHFTPRFGIRFAGMITSQRGHASDAAVELDEENMTDLYRPYMFYAATASLDLMLNLSNCFREYDSRHWFDCYLVLGGGQLYTFGFDKKRLEQWNPEITDVVDANSYRYWQFKGGFEGAWHVARSCDLTTELDFYFAENAYNGMVGSSRKFDFFPSVRIGLTYYLPNTKGRHRFANPKVLHPYWKELN